MKRTGIVKKLSVILSIIAVMALAPALQAAAANDNVEAAFELFGSVTAAEGNNTGATSQGFPEPVSIANPGTANTTSSGRSIWWKWRATYSGAVVISTGIPNAPTNQQSLFDTQLAVFRGTDPVNRAALQLVASNEDHPSFAGGSPSLSRVDFTATEGTYYYIMVDSYAGDFTGVAKVYLNPGTYVPPQVAPNDNAFWWQNRTTGEIAFWNVNSAMTTAESFGTIPVLKYAGWDVFAVEDWDGNGARDFFVQSTSGHVGLWLMGGEHKKTFLQGAWINPNPISGWKAVGLADMNNDGVKDLVWSSVGSPLAYWSLSKASNVTVTGFHWIQSPYVPNGWKVVGIGNFSGSNRKDFLWQSTGGQLALWPQNVDGTYKAAEARLLNTPAVGSYWNVGSTRDLNGDGSLDVLWVGGGGELAFWPMNNAVLNTPAARVLPLPKAAGWNFVAR